MAQNTKIVEFYWFNWEFSSKRCRKYTRHGMYYQGMSRKISSGIIQLEHNEGNYIK